MRHFRFNLLTLLAVLTIAAVAIVWGQQWRELQRLRASHRALLEANLERHQRERDRWNFLVGKNNPALPLIRMYSEYRSQEDKKIAAIKRELGELCP
jgi:hypothetical protein